MKNAMRAEHINFNGNIDEQAIKYVCEEGYNCQEKLIRMHEDSRVKMQLENMEGVSI